MHKLIPRTLGRVLGASFEELEELSALGDRGYRSWLDNGPKARIISEPVPRLKLIQKRLLHRVLRRIDDQPSTGHGCGRGVEWTLGRHVGDAYLLRVDIADFFPSVSPEQVQDSLRRVGIPKASANTIARLVTFRGSLPLGAPTSVTVGDLVLFPLDRRLQGLATRYRLTYSRYVDDVLVSGGEALRHHAAGTVRGILADLGWRTNSKGGLMGPGDRHLALGALLNQRLNVDPSYESRVRSRLRLIARGTIQPSPEEITSVLAKVRWILRLNPDRAARFGPLVEVALSRVLV